MLLIESFLVKVLFRLYVISHGRFYYARIVLEMALTVIEGATFFNKNGEKIFIFMKAFILLHTADNITATVS